MHKSSIVRLAASGGGRTQLRLHIKNWNSGRQTIDDFQIPRRPQAKKEDDLATIHPSYAMQTRAHFVCTTEGAHEVPSFHVSRESAVFGRPHLTRDVPATVTNIVMIAGCPKQNSFVHFGPTAHKHIMSLVS